MKKKKGKIERGNLFVMMMMVYTQSQAVCVCVSMYVASSPKLALVKEFHFHSNERWWAARR